MGSNDNNNPSTSKQRKRNIIWFSKNVATKIGRYFLHLLDEHFPQDHKFQNNFQQKQYKS